MNKPRELYLATTEISKGDFGPIACVFPTLEAAKTAISFMNPSNNPIAITAIEATPLTKNAHKMYEALKQMLKDYEDCMQIPVKTVMQAKDALKAVEGK